MYKALYRKWRPRTFDDVCGQNEITDILKYEIQAQKHSHAYLFCGSRGTGKTSCAKILAKALNCTSLQNGNPCNSCEACRSIDAGTATDVIEMDAASNTGVDHVRDMKEELIFLPALLKYRVYIIDEVHMMSGGAFNALLKTLEEPPAHVVFILATTELHKLPSTIVSRCQRFDFKRIQSNVLVSRMMQIAEAEGIALEPSGARLIAKSAQGGMRDAISLLELCAGLKETIDEAQVTRVLGIGTREHMVDFVRAITEKNFSELFRLIDDVVMSSKDLAVYFRDLIDFYRDLMVVRSVGPIAMQYLDLTEEEYQLIASYAHLSEMEQWNYQSKMLEDALENMQRQPSAKRSIAELAVVRLCEPKLSLTAESLLARLSALENKITMLQMNGISSSDPVAQEKEVPLCAETPITQTPPKQTKDTPVSIEDASQRTFSQWKEVIAELSKTKNGLAGFLDHCTCHVSPNGNYLIQAQNAFTVNMLMRQDNYNAIKCAIAAVTEQDLSQREVLIRRASEGDGFGLLDELESFLKDS